MTERSAAAQARPALSSYRLWQRLALAAGLGYAGSWALPPSGIWPAFVLALFLVAFVFRAATTVRQAALTGWAFGTGYFCGAWPWIMEPFWVDAVRHGWMAPFALVFLSAGMALYWGAAFGIAHWLGRTPALRVAALVATIPLAELARAYLFTGFPWAAPSQIWVDWGAAQWLSLIGPHGLTFATVLCAVLPCIAITRHAKWAIVALCVLPTALLVGGGRLLLESRGLPASTDYVVRLVQPNAPQHEKWDPALMPMFFQRQLEFSAAQPRPDLIVWPETAVPGLLNAAEPELALIAEAAAGAPVLLGIQRRGDRGYYNSLVHLDGSGQVAGVYDKHHLVPFGEYIPAAPLASRLGIAGLAQRANAGYAAGPGPEVLELDVGKALPLICYEAVFPQDTRVDGSRPDFLLQITNDAWFGQRIGPYQHLAQAQMRAIEQGLPMMRAANTGISAMIDPYGRITDQLGLGQAGYVDATLPAPLPPTLYARTGDWAALIWLVLVTFALLWRRSRQPVAK